MTDTGDIHKSFARRKDPVRDPSLKRFQFCKIDGCEYLVEVKPMFIDPALGESVCYQCGNVANWDMASLKIIRPSDFK